jgi:hypothetical protein
MADLMDSESYTVARFVSEFGFQSFPFLRTWKKVTQERDLDGGLQSKFITTRQHQSSGNERVFSQTANLFILEERHDEFRSNEEKLGDFIYLSQV